MSARSRPHPVLRRALAIAALLGAIAAPRASLAAADPSWFPLSAGSQWAYDLHRDLTLSPEKAELKRYFYAGRSQWIAEAAPDLAPGGFRIRETSVQQPLGAGGVKVAIAQWTAYSFASELLIHASGETDPDGKRSQAVFKPPLRLLPTTTVGESWNAGTFRQGDQSAELRGKVLGIEDLDGEPPRPGCLKVELKGKLSGSVRVADVKTEIESGSYERVVWFARDVGIVRDVTTLTSDVKLADGRRAQILQTSTERLVEHRPAK